MGCLWGSAIKNKTHRKTSVYRTRKQFNNNNNNKQADEKNKKIGKTDKQDKTIHNPVAIRGDKYDRILL